MMYIGETGRKFSARPEEYETLQRVENDKSRTKHTNYDITNSYTSENGTQHTKMKTI